MFPRCTPRANWIPNYRTAIRALTGSALLVSCAVAADLPERALIGDSFKAGGARPAGAPLNGSIPEIGKLPWKAVGNAVIREDGALTVGSENGATGWMALDPRLSEVPFTAQMDCQPATTDWVGLSLGGELSDFFKTSVLTIILRPNGGYSVFAGNGATTFTRPLANGKAEKYNETGWNRLELRYDPKSGLLTAIINGQKVVDGKNVLEAVAGAKINFAGFRFNETTGTAPRTQAKIPAVDNFAIIPAVDLKPLPAAAAPAPAVAATKPTTKLEPVNQTQFFLNPGETSTLRWKAPAGVNSVKCEVRDYESRTVLARELTTRDGEVSLPLALPAGFYEATLGADRFGLVVSPQYQGKVDHFFAIDAALSWLETRSAMRKDLLALLKRSGIGLVRERVSWPAVNPQEGQYDFETGRSFDTLRAEYRRQGLKLLEVFHSAPNWSKTDNSNPFPQVLPATKTAWQALGNRWGSTWKAIEVWNEPDIDFGGEISADQYLPAVKAVNYALREKKVPSLVGGGVFAYFNPRYIRNAVNNGLLDEVDFVSFHTYAKAPSLERIITDYRTALSPKGKRVLPIWLTESGQAWTSGKERPSTEEDRNSALDITMKSVESRACGIASHFAFVYPFYIEGRHNFGLMGQEVSPLRSMAAYVQAVRALSNKKYVGDLKVASTQRARVFAQGDQAVAVLYTESPAPKSSVIWKDMIHRAEGIDGRVLKRTADGKLPLGDGITYVFTSLKALKGLIPQTAASKLYAVAQKTAPATTTVSPIILQPVPPAGVQPSKRGYVVEEAGLKNFPLKVRVNNLSPNPVKASLRPEVAGISGLEAKSVEVPASGTAELLWNVDLQPAFVKTDSLALGIRGTYGTGTPISPLSFEIFSPRDLDTYRRTYPRSERVAIEDSSRWLSKIGGTGKLQLTSPETGGWQMQASFSGGDRWVYPELPLTKAATWAGSTGLVIRGKANASATVRLMLKERSGATYFTPFSIFPADGKWHTTMIQWADLAALPTAPPDANGKLDFGEVTHLVLGMNSRTDENGIEISDLYLARP